MLYRLFSGVAKSVIIFPHLGDCDLYMAPRGVTGQNQPGLNQELVPKPGARS